MEIKDTRWFLQYRREQWDCAKEITGKIKPVVCGSQIKSGKREVVICCSLIKDKNAVHVYTINLTRKDCKEQIQELNHYGISTFVGIDLRKRYDEIKSYIDSQVALGKEVYLHVDEADYGTGSHQCFADLLKSTFTMPNVKQIYYSATPQEVKYSGIDYDMVDFIPNENYRGAEYFLDNDLVHQAESFFVKDAQGKFSLSEQGEECLNLIDVKAGKYIGVIRLSGSSNKVSYYDDVKTNFGSSKSTVKKSLDKVFGKDNYSVRFVDEKTSLYWGSRDRNYNSSPSWYDYATNRPLIIIINQTCTRSTEWVFQSHLAFYHSMRFGKPSLSTIAQGDTRMMGYRETECRIYTSSITAFKVLAYGDEWLKENAFAEGTPRFSSRISNDSGKGSYDAEFLIEGETVGLEIFEPNDPIHSLNRQGKRRGGKVRETPSIRYKGIHRFTCNRTSTWGIRSNRQTSNLSNAIANGVMSLSDSSKLTFAWLNEMPPNEEWYESYYFLRYCHDSKVTKALDEGRRVFIIFNKKTQPKFTTQSTSVYTELAKAEDPFTE